MLYVCNKLNAKNLKENYHYSVRENIEKNLTNTHFFTKLLVKETFEKI